MRSLGATKVLLVPVCLLGVGTRAAAEQRARPVRGIACNARTGEPLSDTRLYLRGWQVYGDRAEVTTDAQGRFSFADTPGNRISAKPDRKGPECLALPFDLRRWRIERARDKGVESEWDRYDLLEGIAPRAESKWVRREGELVLRVDAPPVGEIQVQVREQTGRPLGETRVELFPAQSSFSYRYNDTLRFTGRTDTEGRFRIRWKPGLGRLYVVVRGTGFGSTGMFEALPGRTVTVELPPLAPFAVIEGRIDPRQLTENSKVTFRSHAWNRTEARFDAEGRFVLRDVTPGEHWLRAYGTTDIKRIRVDVAPGQQLAGLVFKPKTREEKAASEKAIAAFHEAQKALTETRASVTGVVLDERGRPVSGARVFVMNKYHGGIRMYEQVLETVTDRKGRYRIDGVRTGFGSIAVAARVEGRPLALAYGRSEREGHGMTLSTGGLSSGATSAGAVRADLVVPRRGGELDVKVLMSGEPVRGALVRLKPEDWHYFFSPGWAMPHGGEAKKAFSALAQPVRRTDERGVAHFGDLVPGTYTCHAIGEGKPEDLDRVGQWSPFSEDKRPVGCAEGVAVAAGERRCVSVSVYRPELRVRMRVTTPDGRPVVKRRVAVSYGKTGEATGSSTSSETDGTGVLTHRFNSHGLWRFTTRFRDSPLARTPVREGRHYEGSAVVAVSALIPEDRVVHLRTARKGPGSIEAELRDLEGRPARGVVVIESSSWGAPPEYAASADDRGRVRFASLPSREYRLHGYLAGRRALPTLGVDSEDRELTGVVAVPRQTVEVRANRVAEVTLREQYAGYVRGKVKVPAGTGASEYSLECSGRGPLPTRAVCDKQTGNYVCGPASPGKLKVYLRRRDPDARGGEKNAGEFEMQVRAGEVAREDISPVPADQQEPVGSRAGWGAVAGEVVHADGRTPACYARVLKFIPNSLHPVAGGWTGARGEFHTHGLWVPCGPPGQQTNPGGSPDGPVIAAYLPGRCGAAIVPLGRDQKEGPLAALPRQISVSGLVTVGGRPASEYDAVVRVLARHEGKGKLTHVYSIDTTADHDGGFALHGLTPGTYAVQAALDGIWLSRSVKLEVGEGELKPIRLDIVRPGGAAVIQLADAAGRPVRQAGVKVPVPPGPLATLLRPEMLESDEAGRVRLEGLGAGRRELAVLGHRGVHEITVPPLDEPRPTPLAPQNIVVRTDE